ncbi:HINT domain-containing protein [Paenibacillus thiaminolyticus]|uniref:polymorphic toxin-type HINT domain-containing protein n=1 Tax=Paenibacillus thiaminolyticus TaxID=49283 RepID=UPI00232C4EF2|nr:polymorphic toxin-type HINT domain-containing protein [Paenibacillus thiaminolyticus]WCF11209.1 HINT domain-containing protein [Paenibacillus thiaminolyticus]
MPIWSADCTPLSSLSLLTKDELTGKTGYNAVIELFQRQANETYQITVKGITITTTEEHPFWIPGQGWVEARHLKPGDLLQNPEGKRYPIDRIEIKNDSTTVYNFRVEGVHNYFVTELEIWTHNCGAGGIRSIPMRAPTGGGEDLARRLMLEKQKTI